MRSVLFPIVVCSLSLSATAPLPPARFHYTAGDVGTARGTVEAKAWTVSSFDFAPNVDHRTVSLASSFTLSATGVTDSGYESVEARAHSSGTPQCPFIASAAAETSVLWQLSARPAQITFDASSSDVNNGRVEGMYGAQPPGATFMNFAVAGTEEQILTDPLVVEVPFQIVEPALVVMRSLTASRIRIGHCELAPAVPAAGSGGSLLYCLIHDDADQDGVPDGPAFFAEYVVVANGELASTPPSSVALGSGHYVMAFRYERITSEETGADPCQWSTNCSWEVFDHLRAVFEIE